MAGRELPRIFRDDFKIGPNDYELRVAANDPFLKMMYGAPREYEQIEPITEPPSPNTSITRAGMEVLKQQRKGIRCNIDPNIDPFDVYKDVMVRTRKQMKESKKKTQTETELEEITNPVEKWWHSTASVKNAVKDIRSLPFQNETDRILYEMRFLDYVTTIIRRMEQKFHQQRSKYETKAHKQEVMIYFVTEIRQLREKIILEAIESKNLDISYVSRSIVKTLPKLQKPESVTASPKKSAPLPQMREAHSNHLHPSDQTLLNRGLRQTEGMMPDTYRIGKRVIEEVNSTTKAQTAKFLRDTAERLDAELSKPSSCCVTQPSSPRHTNAKKNDDFFIPKRIKPLILTQPVTACPSRKGSPTRAVPRKQPKKINTNVLWKMADPLPNREGSYYDTLGKLKDLTSLNFDYMGEARRQVGEQKMAFEMEHMRTTKEEGAAIDGWSPISFDAKMPLPGLEERTMSRSTVKLTETHTRETSLTSDSTSYYNSQGHNTNAVEFLMGYNREVALDNGGKEIYDELTKIWSSLGFSILQKIEMVVKYCEDPDRSTRLGDALEQWKQVQTVFGRYDSVYRIVKDFLKMEYEVSHQREATYTLLRTDLKIESEHLLEAARSLKASFGDDVMLQRRTVDDLVKDRNFKLDKLYAHARHVVELNTIEDEQLE